MNESTLQWRYVGDEIWLNLYDLSILKGLDGEDGADGKDGNTPSIGEKWQLVDWEKPTPA